MVLAADESVATKANTAFPVDVRVRKLAMLDRSPRLTWRKVSGPGNVTFNGAGTDQVMVTCSRPGSYELEVTVDDGLAPATARLAISVQ